LIGFARYIDFQEYGGSAGGIVTAKCFIKVYFEPY